MLNIRRFGLGWSDPRASSVLGGLAYSKPMSVWSWSYSYQRLGGLDIKNQTNAHL